MSRRRPKQPREQRAYIRAVQEYTLPQVEYFAGRAVELPGDMLHDVHSSATLIAEQSTELRRLRQQAERLGSHAMFEIEMRHLEEEAAVAAVREDCERWYTQDDPFIKREV